MKRNLEKTLKKTVIPERYALRLSEYFEIIRTNKGDVWASCYDSFVLGFAIGRKYQKKSDRAAGQKESGAR